MIEIIEQQKNKVRIGSSLRRGIVVRVPVVWTNCSYFGKFRVISDGFGWFPTGCRWFQVVSVGFLF